MDRVHPGLLLELTHVLLEEPLRRNLNLSECRIQALVRLVGPVFPVVLRLLMNPHYFVLNVGSNEFAVLFVRDLLLVVKLSLHAPIVAHWGMLMK